MVKSTGQNTGDTDITLRDVVGHMQSMEQRLKNEMQVMEKRLLAKIEENTKGIVKNTEAIQALGVRIDVLDEDLTATIKDTIKIRQRVGMATVDD